MPHKVALFITCLTDQFYPQVGIAITKILERLGCEVVFPLAQTCCGQPMYNNGYLDSARELAKHMVEVFEPFDWIVTPSGSCCAMVRDHFHRLLGEDPAWSQGTQNLIVRTYEFVEFLDKVLKADLTSYQIPRPTLFTYHYTCHLRGIGIKDEGVRLLKELGNVEFRPLEKSDQCCGFGGTFAIKYPEISGAIVEDKAACIAATGAQALVCNDAGCTMNIAGMCHRAGATVEVKHFAQVLAEAMGIDARAW